MEVFFNKTSIGYKHIKEGKPCQDYSDYYKNDECTILTACDGHGGALYIRSDRGAKFASAAAIKVLKRHLLQKIPKKYPNELIDKIRLEILCEWNNLVEQDYAIYPFEEGEMASLTSEQKFELEGDYTLAYGTTLHAVCITDELCCCVSIGDGGIFYVTDDGVFGSAFQDDDNEPVANMTYSLCSENAFNKIDIQYLVMLKGYVTGIVLCTDGATNPYLSYDNFTKSFLAPMLKKVDKDGNEVIPELMGFIDKLGGKIGTGDDVSVALYYRRSTDEHKSSNGGFILK